MTQRDPAFVITEEEAQSYADDADDVAIVWPTHPYVWVANADGCVVIYLGAAEYRAWNWVSHSWAPCPELHMHERQIISIEEQQ